MGWKIYFVVLIIIFVLSRGGVFSGDLDLFAYIYSPLAIVSLAGLYGYAFKKPVFRSDFWKMWLPIVVLLDFLAVFLLINSISLIRLVTYGINLPSYVALYLYAFRSKDLWNKNAE